MGIKDIFRKESKYLDSPKELPELASEELNDESRNYFNSNSQNVDLPAPIPPSPENLKADAKPVNNAKSYIEEKNDQMSVKTGSQKEEYEANQINSTPALNNHFPNNYSNQQAINPQFINHPYSPQFYHPAAFIPHNFPQNPIFHPNYFSNVDDNEIFARRVMSSTNYDLVNNSDRGPLRKLLYEMDKLESRWHVLSNQKSGLEKELKYLEIEIEHKMKLLRTHLAIANESNIVEDGDEFHVCDGQVLKSRADLEAVASTMSKQVFDHHVGPGWNDFESWVANCLHDYSLAKRLKNITSVRDLQTALKKY